MSLVRFEMDLPKLTSFDVIKDWQTFTTTFDATVVDADGHIVAIRVREGR